MVFSVDSLGFSGWTVKFENDNILSLYLWCFYVISYVISWLKYLSEAGGGRWSWEVFHAAVPFQVSIRECATSETAVWWRMSQSGLEERNNKAMFSELEEERCRTQTRLGGARDGLESKTGTVRSC